MNYDMEVMSSSENEANESFRTQLARRFRSESDDSDSGAAIPIRQRRANADGSFGADDTIDEHKYDTLRLQRHLLGHDSEDSDSEGGVAEYDSYGVSRLKPIPVHSLPGSQNTSMNDMIPTLMAHSPEAWPPQRMTSGSADTYGHTSAREREPASGVTEVCAVCGEGMRSVADSEVGFVLTYLNEEDCGLLRDADEDIHVNRDAVVHLCHQDHDLKSVLSCLSELDKKDFTFPSFHDLAPAVAKLTLVRKIRETRERDFDAEAVRISPFLTDHISPNPFSQHHHQYPLQQLHGQTSSQSPFPTSLSTPLPIMVSDALSSSHESDTPYSDHVSPTMTYSAYKEPQTSAATFPSTATPASPRAQPVSSPLQSLTYPQQASASPMVQVASPWEHMYGLENASAVSLHSSTASSDTGPLHSAADYKEHLIPQDDGNWGDDDDETLHISQEVVDMSRAYADETWNDENNADPHFQVDNTTNQEKRVYASLAEANEQVAHLEAELKHEREKAQLNRQHEGTEARKKLELMNSRVKGLADENKDLQRTITELRKRPVAPVTRLDSPARTVDEQRLRAAEERVMTSRTELEAVQKEKEQLETQLSEATSTVQELTHMAERQTNEMKMLLSETDAATEHKAKALEDVKAQLADAESALDAKTEELVQVEVTCETLQAQVKELKYRQVQTNDDELRDANEQLRAQVNELKQVAASQDKVAEAREAELTNLQKQLVELKSAHESHQINAKDALDALKRENAAVTEMHENMEKKLTLAEEAKKQLDDELALLKKELSGEMETQASLKQQVQTLQKNSQAEKLRNIQLVTACDEANDKTKALAAKHATDNAALIALQQEHDARGEEMTAVKQELNDVAARAKELEWTAKELKSELASKEEQLAVALEDKDGFQQDAEATNKELDEATRQLNDAEKKLVLMQQRHAKEVENLSKALKAAASEECPKCAESQVVNDELTNTLNELRDSNNALQKECDEKSTELHDANARMETIESKLVATETQLGKLEHERVVTVEAMKEEQRKLEAQLAAQSDAHAEEANSLKEAHAHMEGKHAEAAALHADVSKQLEETQMARELTTKRLHKRAETAEQAHADLKSKTNALRDELAAAEKEKELLRAELKATSEQLAVVEAEPSDTIAALEQQVKDRDMTIVLLQGKVKKQAVMEEQHAQQVEEAVDAAREEAAEVRKDDAIKHAHELETVQGKLNRAESDLKKALANEKKVQDLLNEQTGMAPSLDDSFAHRQDMLDEAYAAQVEMLTRHHDLELRQVRGDENVNYLNKLNEEEQRWHEAFTRQLDESKQSYDSVTEKLRAERDAAIEDLARARLKNRASPTRQTPPAQDLPADVAEDKKMSNDNVVVSESKNDDIVSSTKPKAEEEAEKVQASSPATTDSVYLNDAYVTEDDESDGDTADAAGPGAVAPDQSAAAQQAMLAEIHRLREELDAAKDTANTLSLEKDHAVAQAQLALQRSKDIDLDLYVDRNEHDAAQKDHEEKLAKRTKELHDMRARVAELERTVADAELKAADDAELSADHVIRNEEQEAERKRLHDALRASEEKVAEKDNFVNELAEEFKAIKADHETVVSELEAALAAAENQLEEQAADKQKKLADDRAGVATIVKAAESKLETAQEELDDALDRERALDAEVSALNDEIVALKEQLMPEQQSEVENARLREQVEDLQAKLKDRDEYVVLCAANFDEAAEEHAKEQAQLKATAAHDRKAAQAQRDQLQHEVDTLQRQLQEAQDTHKTDVLAHQGSADEKAKALEALQEEVNAQKERQAQLEQDLAAKEAELANRSAEMEQLRADHLHASDAHASSSESAKELETKLAATKRELKEAQQAAVKAEREASDASKAAKQADVKYAEASNVVKQLEDEKSAAERALEEEKRANEHVNEQHQAECDELHDALDEQARVLAQRDVADAKRDAESEKQKRELTDLREKVKAVRLEKKDAVRDLRDVRRQQQALAAKVEILESTTAEQRDAEHALQAEKTALEEVTAEQDKTLRMLKAKASSILLRHVVNKTSGLLVKQCFSALRRHCLDSREHRQALTYIMRYHCFTPLRLSWQKWRETARATERKELLDNHAAVEERVKQLRQELDEAKAIEENDQTDKSSAVTDASKRHASLSESKQQLETLETLQRDNENLQRENGQLRNQLQQARKTHETDVLAHQGTADEKSKALEALQEEVNMYKEQHAAVREVMANERSREVDLSFLDEDNDGDNENDEISGARKRHQRTMAELRKLHETVKELEEKLAKAETELSDMEAAHDGDTKKQEQLEHQVHILQRRLEEAQDTHKTDVLAHEGSADEKSKALEALQEEVNMYKEQHAAVREVMANGRSREVNLSFLDKDSDDKDNKDGDNDADESNGPRKRHQRTMAQLHKLHETVADLEEKLAKAEKDLKEQSLEAESLREQHSDAVDAHDDTRADLTAELEAKAAELDALQKALTEAEAKNADDEAQLMSLAAASQSARAKLVDQLRESAEKQDLLQRQLNDMEKVVDTMQADLAEARVAVSNAQDENVKALAGHRAELAELHKELADMQRAQTKALSEATASMRAANEQEQAHVRELSAKETELESLRRREIASQKQIAGQEHLVQELEQSKKELEQELAAAKKSSPALITHYEARQSEAVAALHQAQAEKERLAEQLKQQTQEHKSVSDKLARAEAQCEQLEQQLEAVQDGKPEMTVYVNDEEDQISKHDHDQCASEKAALANQVQTLERALAKAEKEDRVFSMRDFELEAKEIEIHEDRKSSEQRNVFDRSTVSATPSAIRKPPRSRNSFLDESSDVMAMVAQAGYELIPQHKPSPRVPRSHRSSARSSRLSSANNSQQNDMGGREHFVLIIPDYARQSESLQRALLKLFYLLEKQWKTALAGFPGHPTPRDFWAKNDTHPAWVADNKRKTCLQCHVEFGFMNRKHHCRMCGDIVCWSCSNQIMHLPESREATISCRVCTSCSIPLRLLYEDAALRAFDARSLI